MPPTPLYAASALGTEKCSVPLLCPCIGRVLAMSLYSYIDSANTDIKVNHARYYVILKCIHAKTKLVVTSRAHVRRG